MNGLWSIDPATMTVIVIAAVVTYLCRVGGHFVVSFFKPSRRVEKALAALPAASLCRSSCPSWCGPGIVAGLAVMVAAATMVVRRRRFLALAVALPRPSG